VNTWKRYGIKFNPYLWIKYAPLASPNHHVVAETIADVVDPDGCHARLYRESIAARSRGISVRTVTRVLADLEAQGLLRELLGDERDQVLAASRKPYRRGELPRVFEMLIPASAYEADDLERVNRMRLDRGRPAITPESRPDLGAPVGGRKEREDVGTKRPKGKPTGQIDLFDSTYDDAPQPATGPQDREDDPEEVPGTTSPGCPGLVVPTARDYKSHTPSMYDHPPAPSADFPSVGGSLQGGDAAAEDPDGPADAPRDGDQGGGAARQPADPARTAAEAVVDRLLAHTAELGADPLTDPGGDREHLVALAAAALEGGMTPGRLWGITSAGLRNVRKQWALSARLADPEAFASVKQVEFGGTLLRVPPQAPPLCETHPEVTSRAPDGECAGCRVDRLAADRDRALAEGAVLEYRRDESGAWVDQFGHPAPDDDAMAPDARDLLEQSRASMQQASERHQARAGKRPRAVGALDDGGAPPF
jgi:hypothetical protein